jgi:hypothetical protein
VSETAKYNGDELVNAMPQVLHEGRYRLYEKPDGGLHLVYLVDGQETEQHMEIPGAMLRLARMASEGNMTFPQFVKEAARLRRELHRTRVTRT